MKNIFKFLISLLILTIAFLFNYGCSSSNYTKVNQQTLPGKYKNYTLLPNGWKLTPVGDQVGIGDLPLNIIVTKDEKYAITSNSGYSENSLSVVSLEKLKEVQRIKINKTWRGLAFNSDDSKLYVSGANDESVKIYKFSDGNLSLTDSILIPKEYPKEKISVTGVAFVKSKNILFAVSKESNSLYVIDANKKSLIKKIKLSGKCYDVIVNHKETLAYVSVWGSSSVVEINLNGYTVSSIIKTGAHPSDMIVTKNDALLYVTNTNHNTTSVIDLKTKKEIEKINSSLIAEAPYGSTPDAVCLSSDETKLFIANADNNYLAVFDVSKKSHSKSRGFIPVGWYPTAVKFLSKTNRIIVANGKGLSSMANPKGPNPYKKIKRKLTQYIASLFKGTLSVIKEYGTKTLAVYTKKVYSNTPYIYKKKTLRNNQKVISAKHNLIPSKKIKYVFYIIKENRTYDQVFGDIPKGNGDSSLCIFGKKVTPNQHNISNDFTLYDNFYADAEVSADGHNWSTAAYATDYVEKTWPVLYGRRGGTYDYEGGTPIAAPSSGYIWDNVIKHNKSLRNYGEFVDRHKDKNGFYKVRNKYMIPFTNREYPPFDLNVSDLKRYKVWKKEFDEAVKNNTVSNFNILRLPNDHCWGTAKGRLTPTAYVAQNDYALGLMVDKISHSKIWKESIIFVVEDDAQSGSDHVDAHRSMLMVIGPYVKRNFIDHTMYSTSSVLKTIELILGLPPMTQYDLSATPILKSISDQPNYNSFNVIKPETDIKAKNIAGLFGAKRSLKWDFSKEDAIPDVQYSEIIWKSVKGRNSIMPPPVRSAFVKIKIEKDDD